MNRTVPILILLVLLFLLGGFIFLYIKGDGEGIIHWTLRPKVKTESTFEDQKEIEMKRAEKDATSYNIAIKEKKIELCESIYDTDKQQECRDMILAAKALQDKNKDLCSILTSTGIRDRCEDNITYFLAEEKGEIVLCDMIHEETIRTQCKKSIDETKLDIHFASGELDIGFCDTMNDAGLRDDCTRKITVEKDSAQYRLAVANTSLTECDAISDSVTLQKCRDAVLFDLAVSEGNLDYCNNILNTERSDFCRKSLLSRKDVSRYQQIVRTGNLDSCEELTVIQMKNQCHDTILYAKVRETQDETFCDMLYNTGIISQCREMTQKEKEKQ